MHWITDSSGDVDYTRLRSLVSIGLALIGGAAAIWTIFLVRNVNTALVSIVVTALVLPLTGGKVTDAIMQKVNASATAKVVAGTAPGRRASDPDVHPPSNP